MNREEFKNRLIEDVKNELGEGYTVQFKKTEKVSESYEGVAIKLKDSIMGMSLNADELYVIYALSDDYAFAWEEAQRRIQIFRDTYHGMEEMVRDINDYQKLKDRLVVELVSRDSVPENVAFTKWNDLAVIAKIIFQDDENGQTSHTVTKDLLKEWQQNINQVMYDAVQNSQKLRPAKIIDMIDEMIELKEEMQEEMNEGMAAALDKLRGGQYVISNNKLMNGASAVLYDGVLEKVSRLLGGSFYLIPSSRHEFLAQRPEEDISGDELNYWITDVNFTQLSKADRLADHAYFYDAVTKAVKEI